MLRASFSCMNLWEMLLLIFYENLVEILKFLVSSCVAFWFWISLSLLVPWIIVDPVICIKMSYLNIFSVIICTVHC